ncbi:MAG: hypothetical protein MZW92_66355 [Comamonadaceae bacterium]|nr:hypothetical protein [Comamonadaceae bacterium]
MAAPVPALDAARRAVGPAAATVDRADDHQPAVPARARSGPDRRRLAGRGHVAAGCANARDARARGFVPAEPRPRVAQRHPPAVAAGRRRVPAGARHRRWRRRLRKPAAAAQRRPAGSAELRRLRRRAGMPADVDRQRLRHPAPRHHDRRAARARP